MNRLAGLALLLPHYARTAWKGFVGHRMPGSGDHLVAQAAIFDGDRVLLTVRSDLRGWELPGGRLERGESPDAAVVREVREETGLAVAIEREVGRYHRTGFLPHTAIVYRCRPTGGEPTPSHETPRVAWWPVDGLPGTLFPWYRGPLLDALGAGDTPAERHEHQGWREILAGLRIDLRMRISDDRAR